MKKIITYLITITGMLLLFTSCADAEYIEMCVTGYQYGFWSGMWHGSISMFSLIGSIFSDDITVYAVNNTGFWYDFGFVFGIGGILKLITSLFRI